jgi:hypothetical protein
MGIRRIDERSSQSDSLRYIVLSITPNVSAPLPGAGTQIGIFEMTAIPAVSWTGNACLSLQESHGQIFLMRADTQRLIGSDVIRFLLDEMAQFSVPSPQEQLSRHG